MTTVPIVRSGFWARICRLSSCVCVLLAACASASAQTPADDLARIAQSAPGRVGVAALVIESGATLEYDANGRFPMQSVYKFPIAMAVLHEVDRRVLSLEQRVTVSSADLVLSWQHSPIRDGIAKTRVFTVRELLRYMVVESDGTACDVLLRLVGGPEKVTAYLRDLGNRDVIVATTEIAMGRDEQMQDHNWATPKGMVALLRTFQEGKELTQTSRDLLRNMMLGTTTGPRRLKGMLPPGAVVAHKTGTSRTVAGLTRATNDVGIIDLPDGRHLAIAVFVADSTAGDDAREALIAKSARLAWDTFAEQPRAAQ
jgi:beta-lactamase class A